MRIRTKWHKKDRVVSIDEKANTLAFIIWRIAAAMVLNLENENFQTDTQQQRLDIIKEILAFLISVTDRMVSEQMSQEERQDLISKLALKLVKVMQENSEDLIGKGDFQGPFIELLNDRMNAYAICSWDGDQPGYQYKRDFGDFVARQMGEKDNKWITTYVIDIEVPQALETLTKAKLEMVDGRSTAQLGS